MPSSTRQPFAVYSDKISILLLNQSIIHKLFWFCAEVVNSESYSGFGSFEYGHDSKWLVGEIRLKITDVKIFVVSLIVNCQKRHSEFTGPFYMDA